MLVVRPLVANWMWASFWVGGVLVPPAACLLAGVCPPRCWPCGRLARPACWWFGLLCREFADNCLRRPFGFVVCRHFELYRLLCLFKRLATEGVSPVLETVLGASRLAGGQLCRFASRVASRLPCNVLCLWRPRVGGLGVVGVVGFGWALVAGGCGAVCLFNVLFVHRPTKRNCL